MDVKTAVRTKYAVRDFTEQPLPEAVIADILHAGRRAQSSKNTQPWAFVVVRDRERLQALSGAGNYASHIPKAAAVICLVSGKQYSAWEAFDFGQACAYMQLAAWEAGVGSCIAAFHRPDEAAAVLKLPDDKTCWVALSFGYPPPDFKPAKGGRKPIDDLTHWETW
jgi:nitroreductase